jgi:hypothetical protein
MFANLSIMDPGQRAWFIISISFTSHGSLKVVAKINHLNKEEEQMIAICILYASRMLSATLVEDSMYDRHQPIAANIHRISLFHRKKVRPHVN